MSKEYERIRTEVHKRYKDELECLRFQNDKLSKALNKKDDECKKLKMHIYHLEHKLQGQRGGPLNDILRHVQDIYDMSAFEVTNITEEKS